MQDFRIDAIYTQLDQFASQWEHVSPELQAWIREHFGGGESPSFYPGLLAGYANCLSMVKTLPADQLEPIIGAIIAFVASEVRRKQYARSPT